MIYTLKMYEYIYMVRLDDVKINNIERYYNE